MIQKARTLGKTWNNGEDKLWEGQTQERSIYFKDEIGKSSRETGNYGKDLKEYKR